jgi:hypothetical protein
MSLQSLTYPILDAQFKSVTSEGPIASNYNAIPIVDFVPSGTVTVVPPLGESVFYWKIGAGGGGGGAGTAGVAPAASTGAGGGGGAGGAILTGSSYCFNTPGAIPPLNIPTVIQYTLGAGGLGGLKGEAVDGFVGGNGGNSTLRVGNAGSTITLLGGGGGNFGTAAGAGGVGGDGPYGGGGGQGSATDSAGGISSGVLFFPVLSGVATIPAAGKTITVNNPLINADSIVTLQFAGDADADLTRVYPVCTPGVLTITGNDDATADVLVNYIVSNPNGSRAIATASGNGAGNVFPPSASTGTNQAGGSGGGPGGVPGAIDTTVSARPGSLGGGGAGGCCQSATSAVSSGSAGGDGFISYYFVSL